MEWFSPNYPGRRSNDFGEILKSRVDIKNRTTLIAAIVAFLSLVAFFVFVLKAPSTLYLELAVDNDGQGQVYIDSGNGYVPDKVRQVALVADGRLHKYALDIRNSLPRSIRLDPGSSIGNVRVAQIRFENRLYSRNVSCAGLRLLHAMVRSQENLGECHLQAVADDPYLDFAIASTYRSQDISIEWLKLLEGLSFAVITFLLIRFALTRDSQRWPQSHWFLNARSLRLYALLALGFFTFIFLNLHTSSVAEWRNFVVSDIPSGVLAGKSRAIRSDEWLVQTPFYASQASRGFDIDNPSLGANGVTLVSTVPVQGAYGYSQPRFWGFYILGFEKGFSWLYGWRVFGLLLAMFVLCSILTKGDFLLSLMGAGWIALSPFTQWWFTTNLPDMVIGFAAGISALYFLLATKSTSAAFASSVVLFFAGITFVTALYPAFLIPLFYLAVFIVMGLILRDKLYLGFIDRPLSKTICLIMPVVAVIWILLDWLKLGSLPISLIQNSVYPGKRVSLGGDLPLEWVFSGYFSPFFGAGSFPRSMENESHGSNFLLLFPLAWVAMAIQYWRTKHIDALSIAISSYITFIVLWIGWGWPDWLAASTGMSMSPPIRSLIGIGLASIFLIVTVASTAGKSLSPNDMGKPKSGRVVFSAVVLLLIFAVIAFWLNNAYPDFVTPWRVAIMLPAMVLWGLAFLFGLRRLLVGLTTLMVLPGLAANPLAYGVAHLQNAELAIVLKEDQASGNTKWLAFSNLLIPQYLKAHGASVWNGVRFISDPDEIRILDPGERFREIWYRYAHFIAEPAPVQTPVSFELKSTDVVLLRVDACSDAIRTLGINRFAFMTKPSPDQSSCLEPLRPGPVAGFWLYKRQESGKESDITNSVNK